MQASDHYRDYGSNGVASTTKASQFLVEVSGTDSHHSDAVNGDLASDPDDFYRQHNPPLDKRPEIVVGGDSGTMSPTHQRTHANTNGILPRPIQASNLGELRSGLRSVSGPAATRNPPLGAAKPASALNIPTGSRPSIKDLLSRFETPQSMGPDQSSTVRYGKPQPPTRSRALASSPFGASGTTAPKAQKPVTSKQEYDKENSTSSTSSIVMSPRRPAQRQSSTSVTPTAPTASNSATGYAAQSTLRRKPLFGEIIPGTVGAQDVGHGISRRRRGSEGSMHRPNAMFSHNRSQSDMHIMHTPSTHDSTGFEAPNRTASAQGHARSRSDFTGAPEASSGGVMLPGVNWHSPTTLMSPSFPRNHNQNQRQTQSRIPVRTRRHSSTSDSNSSIHSSRASSATNEHRLTTNPPSEVWSNGVGLTARDNAARKRPFTPPTTLTSRRYGSPAVKTTGINNTLKAYIKTPSPTKSPRLRSSRPRQPVSSATTAASRAKMTTSQRGTAHRSIATTEDSLTQLRSDSHGVSVLTSSDHLQDNSGEILEDEYQSSDLENSQFHDAVHNVDEATPFHHTEVFNSFGSDQPASSLDSNNPSRYGPKLVLTVEGLAPPTETEPLSAISGITEFDESPVLSRLPAVEPSSAHDFETQESKAPVEVAIEEAADPSEPSEDRLAGDQRQAMGRNGSALGQLVSRIRERSSSSTARTEFAEDSVSEVGETDSIPIALGTTPVDTQQQWPVDEQQYLRAPPAAHYRHDVDPRSSYASDTSAFEEDEHEHDRSSRALSSVHPDDSVSVVLGNRSDHRGMDNHTLGVMSTPRNRHFTLDSEGRSVVNRILDQYHLSLAFTPEMAHNFRQQVEAVTPKVDKHDHWDSREATLAYLQGLLDLRPSMADRSSTAVHNTDYHDDSPNSSAYEQGFESSPNDEHRGTAIVYRQNELYRQTSADGSPLVKTGVHYSPNASVSTLRQTSPEATAETSFAAKMPSEYRPTPPPKDWRVPPGPNAINFLQLQGEHYSSASEELKTRSAGIPQLPEIEGAGEGLGLAIQVTARKDSPTLPPPIPSHSPPPPPLQSAIGETLPPSQQPLSPPSSDVHTRTLATSVSPNASLDTADAGRRLKTAGNGDDVAQDGPRPSLEASADPSNHAEPVRDSIDSVARTSGRSLSPLSQQDSVKKLRQRRNIIKELVDTEYSYHQDMTVMEDIYKGTSTGTDTFGGILSDDDRRVLFGNSDQIRNFSHEFLDALKQAAVSVYKMPKSMRWAGNQRTSLASGTTEHSSSASQDLMDPELQGLDQQTSIGKAFRDNMARMEKVYGDYLRNHNAANHRLKALLQHSNVQLWLNECVRTAEDLTTTWSLDSLLVKPMQRLLKYPLLLDNLVKCTGEDHPDYADLVAAHKELLYMTNRINETNKRIEIVTQVRDSGRKDSDAIKIALGKNILRRAGKMRQHVGLTSSAGDQEYEAIAQKFGGHFFQLQIVMRDVEKYVDDVQSSVDQANQFISALDSFANIDRPTEHEVILSTWSRYSRAIHELTAIALPEHKAAVRRTVIEPIITLWRLHENPQRMMQKRKKYKIDYAKSKENQEKGIKDKKVEDAAEKFIAINETLKEELPKLYALSKTLIEACLKNFIDLTVQWQQIWARKTRHIWAQGEPRNTGNLSDDLNHIVDAFTADWRAIDDEVKYLGICNGSISNALSPTPTFGNDDASSRKRPSTYSSSKRTMSLSSDQSTLNSPPEMVQRHSGSHVHTPLVGAFSMFGAQPLPSPTGRARATSALSSRGPSTPRSFSANTPSSSYFPPRPATAAGRSTEPAPGLHRLSVEFSSQSRPSSGSNFLSPDYAANAYPAASTGKVFDSAMPMSDSPVDTRAASPQTSQDEPEVLFLAASLFEFNIDASRTEGGKPYLRYVPGEVFDVIGQKGELWLARNQDDPSKLVGWIWEKHFARILPDAT